MHTNFHQMMLGSLEQSSRPRDLCHTYMIELEAGQIICRHVDHLQSCTKASTLSSIFDWTDLGLDSHNESK